MYSQGPFLFFCAVFVKLTFILPVERKDLGTKEGGVHEAMRASIVAVVVDCGLLRLLHRQRCVLGCRVNVKFHE